MSVPVGDNERKRRWDATAIPSDSIPEQVDDQVQQLPSTTNANDDVSVREFEINDHPGRPFAMMSNNIRAVERKNSVVIVSKGKYIPPDATPPPSDARELERKLFLKICGSTQANVEAAIEEIKTIMTRGTDHNSRPDRGGGVGGVTIPRIWADMDIESAPGLDVVERITGVNREYFAFIEKETGSSLTLVGRGIDDNTRDRLHILIRGNNSPGTGRAKMLALSLVKTVKPIYDDYRHRYFGIVRPRKGPNGNRWLSGVPYRSLMTPSNMGRPHDVGNFNGDMNSMNAMNNNTMSGGFGVVQRGMPPAQIQQMGPDMNSSGGNVGIPMGMPPSNAFMHGPYNALVPPHLSSHPPPPQQPRPPAQEPSFLPLPPPPPPPASPPPPPPPP